MDNLHVLFVLLCRQCHQVIWWVLIHILRVSVRVALAILTCELVHVQVDASNYTDVLPIVVVQTRIHPPSVVREVTLAACLVSLVVVFNREVLGEELWDKG
jgi:hypothetical protein